MTESQKSYLVSVHEAIPTPVTLSDFEALFLEFKRLYSESLQKAIAENHNRANESLKLAEACKEEAEEMEEKAKKLDFY